MIALPTLSTRGWAKTPETIIDNVMTYYVSNNPSQSFTYRGEVFSLQSAIKDGGGSMDAIAENVRHGLGTMLKRYFPKGINIDVVPVPINGFDDSKINLEISGYVITDDGKLNIIRALHNINSHYINVADVIIKR